ncbi:MAG TPA: hypothetical protein VEZ47_12475 [Gemmatirosa sp.]|nr:hypothetical protein [Gemmatirosa sp.]
MTGPSPAPLPPWATAKTAGMPAPDSPLDRQYAAFVGPRWATYRRKFAPFFEDARFQPTWNWAAALCTLFGPLWFLYRKLYVPAIAFWMLPQIALSLLWRGEPISMQDVTTNADLKLLVGGVTLSTVILAGGTANFLLFRRAQAAIRLVQSRGASEEQAQSLLARVGRVNAIAVLGGLALMLVSFGLYQGGVR